MASGAVLQPHRPPSSVISMCQAIIVSGLCTGAPQPGCSPHITPHGFSCLTSVSVRMVSR
jgi:hypothetical protein